MDHVNLSNLHFYQSENGEIWGTTKDKANDVNSYAPVVVPGCTVSRDMSNLISASLLMYRSVNESTLMLESIINSLAPLPDNPIYEEMVNALHKIVNANLTVVKTAQIGLWEISRQYDAEMKATKSDKIL